MVNIPYIKVGDTLSVPIQWVDKATGLGIAIDSETSISCRFLTSYGAEFFPDVIIDSDQTNNAGYFTLFMTDVQTSEFLPCKITTDIEITVSGKVKHSDDFIFEVRRSIT